MVGPDMKPLSCLRSLAHCQPGKLLLEVSLSIGLSVSASFATSIRAHQKPAAPGLAYMPQPARLSAPRPSQPPAALHKKYKSHPQQWVDEFSSRLLERGPSYL